MLEQRIQQLWPTRVWGETRLLVAISGGADSVALLLALTRLAGSTKLIDAAHFNHQWRGSESDGDQEFVTDLCRGLGVRLYAERASHIDGVLNTKSEEAARNARYEFLTRTAYRIGARYVVTGHTASDRIETLLHNLFRGTGLAGVSTPTATRMLDQDLVLARPLLTVWRAEVSDYLKRLGQAFRQDSSNENLEYRRNFLRQQLLPLLRQHYGEQVDDKLLSFSSIAQECHSLLHSLASAYLLQAENVQAENCANAELRQDAERDRFIFPCKKMLPAEWPVVQQALNQVWLDRNWSLQKMSRSHWQRLKAAWETLPSRSETVASEHLPGNISLRHRQGFVILEVVWTDASKESSE